jgi:hypothetical protein
MMRVSIALVAYKSISQLGSYGVIALGDAAPLNMYRPIGVLLAWPGVPSAEIMAVAVTLGKLASVAMLFGICSRPAAALSALCMWMVTCYDAAFSLPWSHGFNLPMLVSLGFIGARGGDTLSIDAMLRRVRGLPSRVTVTNPAAYRWPVILVTGIVALTFFCASCIKLWSGGWHLSWIFSDNLRHQIASRFGDSEIQRSAVADWIVQSPWRYETTAFLNIANQILPMSCLLLMHRPWLRLLLGVCVAGEIIGLGVVMQLWNHHWFPLLVVFIDFDRVIAYGKARIGRTASVGATATVPLVLVPGWARWHRRYLAVFSLLFMVVAFGLDQRPKLYPFSSFPMYAKIRASKPYNQHLPFDVVSGRIDVVCTPPLPVAALKALNQDMMYSKLWRAQPALLSDGLKGLIDHVVRAFPGHAVSMVRVYRSALRIPAYPAAPDPTIVNLRLVGERDVAGNVRFDQPP